MRKVPLSEENRGRQIEKKKIDNKKKNYTDKLSENQNGLGSIWNANKLLWTGVPWILPNRSPRSFRPIHTVKVWLSRADRTKLFSSLLLILARSAPRPRALQASRASSQDFLHNRIFHHFTRGNRSNSLFTSDDNDSRLFYWINVTVWACLPSPLAHPCYCRTQQTVLVTTAMLNKLLHRIAEVVRTIFPVFEWQGMLQFPLEFRLFSLISKFSAFTQFALKPLHTVNTRSDNAAIHSKRYCFSCYNGNSIATR